MKFAYWSGLIKGSTCQRRQPKGGNRGRYRVPRLEWLERRLAPAGFDTLGSALVPAFDATLHAHDSRPLGTNAADLYAVTLKAGEAIIADAVIMRPGSTLVPALRIFDSGGKQLPAENSRNGLDPELSYAATAGGIYYVGVSSANNLGYDPNKADTGTGGTSVGNFTIDLTRLPAATEREASGATGQNDTPQTAESLVPGTNLSGNLPSGDVDV